MTIEKLEEDIEYFNVRIAEFKQLAQKYVDAYFLWWKSENKKALTLKKLGMPIEVGRLAPIINDRKGNGKVYINWYKYKASMQYQHNKKYAEYLEPYKLGYTKKLFERHAQSWEIDMVYQTEQKLSIIRKLLESYHQQIVLIKRVIKNENI